MADQPIDRMMTFEEFDAQYSGKRYEYVDGLPLPRAPEVVAGDGTTDVLPKSVLHLLVASRVGYVVGKYVLENQLGVPLVSGVGFFMQREPPELREADIAYLTPQSARRAALGDWLPFPPDFAADIVTEWDTDDYIQRKARSYMANGTRLLWVVYPHAQRVDVYAPDTPMQRYERGDMLDGGDVLPGLRVSVDLIFDFSQTM